MRKLTLSLAVMTALLPGYVLPLGLGEIELNSALNQELEAEIPVLSAAPEDAEQLLIKLASREAFARAGIDRPFVLQDLKFKTVLKGDKPYIQIYTTDPVREPFLSFLIEVDWPNGHLLREYTLLLDPPVFNVGADSSAAMDDGGQEQAFFDAPAEVTAEPAAASQFEPLADDTVADAGYVAAPSMQSSAMAADAAPSVAADTASSFPAPRYNQQASGQYRVKEQDTLWSLAERLRPNSNVSVEQMMLALVNENPECFINENVNGLKRGYILRMPDPANITTVDRQTALEQVRQHNALWREYRQTMSAAVPASAMESEGEATDASAQTPDGRLSIVSAGGEQGSEASLAGQDPKSQLSQLKRELSMARESLASERLEKENLRERLADLEERVQRVLEMDDAELAKLQADLAGAKQQASKVTPPVTELPAAAPADEAAADEVTTPAGKTEQADGQLFVDEAAAPVEPETAMESRAVETETPAEPEQPPVVEQQPAVPGLFSPMNIGLVAGVVVLIGGLVALVLRRRKAKVEEPPKWAELSQPGNFDEIESVGEPYVKQASGAAAAVQAAGKSEASMEDTVTSTMQDTVISLPGEDETGEAETRDDVLAEADVYLAYGIYQQAEELLRNALQQHPERDDYRMKLLETHFASKNASAFADLAAEARERKGSVKSYWDRVVVMGRELCPDNAMFAAGASLMPGFDAEDLLPNKPQTTDLELDAGPGTMAPDLDLGFTETPAAEPDFALDTESTMIMQQPVVAAEPEPAVADFDLAADLENIASAMGAGTSAPAAAPMDADLDLGELDFTSDAELTGGASAAMDAGLDEDFSLDFEASDLGLATGDEAQPATEAGLDMDLDMGDLDLAAETAETADSSAAMTADLDMAELGGGDDDFDISQLSEDIDEVSTKLDLARAYMDMGDNEGARNILEEVRAEGNPEQKKQAEDLLAKAS